MAESEFEGFRGTELFRPVEGVQEEWTALYRFDNAADLDTWLISEQRKQLLAEGEKFADFHSRTIDNSFGSWFAFDEHGNEAPPPSEIKTSIAVWVGLYPTVVLLTLALSPLQMPLWLGLLVGNLLSSFAMSFVTMPYYVNPLLKPGSAAPDCRRHERTGAASARSPPSRCSGWWCSICHWSRVTAGLLSAPELGTSPQRQRLADRDPTAPDLAYRQSRLFHRRIGGTPLCCPSTERQPTRAHEHVGTARIQGFDDSNSLL